LIRRGTGDVELSLVVDGMVVDLAKGEEWKKIYIGEDKPVVFTTIVSQIAQLNCGVVKTRHLFPG